MSAYYYRGIAHRFLSNLNLAKKDFESFTTLRNDNYDGYLELAKTEMFAGEFPEAKEYYLTCIKINPFRPEAYFFQGDMDYRKNDLEGAEKNYRKSIEVDTSYSPGRVRLAIIAAAKSKNSISALPELNHILGYDTTSREALLFRALVTRHSDPKSALSDINRLIRLSQMNVNLRFVRGMVLVEARDFDGAFLDFKTVLRSQVRNVDQFSQKLDLQNACEYVISKIYGETEENQMKIKEGFSKLVLGRCSDAIEALRQVDGYERSALCRYMMGIANQHMKNHEDALANYSSACQLDSSIIDPHIKIGLYNLDVEKLQGSELEFTKALKLNPELKAVRLVRAVVFIRQENYKNAITDLTNVLDGDSVNQQALILRFKAYQLAGDSRSAMADHNVLRRLRDRRYERLKRIVTQMISNKDTTYALSFLQSQSSRSAEAAIMQIEILLRQKKLDVAAKVADYVIGIIRLNLTYYLESDQAFLVAVIGKYQASKNNSEIASQYFDKAIAIDRENSFCYLERGKFYLARRKKQLAKQDLKKAVDLGQNEAKILLARLK